MTPEHAVSRGVLVVNGSVMIAMFGIPALAVVTALVAGRNSTTVGGVAGLAFLFSWPIAWLTWSLLVPRWRVWAYGKVENLDELKRQGVAAGLLWRDGHFLERTEIRTSEQRRRIRELEAAWTAKYKEIEV